jgi:hypothetical protein
MRDRRIVHGHISIGYKRQPKLSEGGAGTRRNIRTLAYIFLFYELHT